MEELKACPFCGGKANLITNICEENNYTGYYIYHTCFNFGISKISTDLKDTKEDAIRSWNRRTNNE